MAKKVLKMTISRTVNPKPFETFRIETGAEYEVPEEDFETERENLFANIMEYILDKEQLLKEYYANGGNKDE